LKRLILLFFFVGPALQAISQEALPAPPAELILSVPAGFYPDAVNVDVKCPGGQVFYTLDGTEPTSRSRRYDKPLTIAETSVLRLLATYKDGRADLLEGHSFFIGEPETDFPVVSIGINPPTLFHPFHGLFMLGANAVDTLWKKPGANFWSKREVTCNLEIFESSGQCVYRSPSGFRLFGGMSRLFPQKSMALVARDRYGEHRIDHEIFGKPGNKKFKFLVLRNSGSDFGKSHFRDAMMTSLVEDWDLETQDNRPAHVYINGRYWGIYNIREKINRYFIDNHFKTVENDSVDIMEHRYTLKRGSARHYRSLLRYLERHDLSDPEHFAYVAAQMEIDNFLDYQIAQIYFDNKDAGGNIRYWRPQTERGRWRWILYDTDWGFGLHEPSAYKHNSLVFHTDPSGPSWPNPPWSTFLLRKLLENEDCRRRFVNRFADRLNTSFEPGQVLRKINFFHERLKPEMNRHLERWKLSRYDWDFHINVMRTFAQERPRFVRMHLMEYLQTGAQRELTVGSTKGGQVVLNENLTLSADTLNGTYFERFPVKLRVVAHHGYRFSHWAGDLEGTDARELTLPLSRKHTQAYAVFEPYFHPLESKLVINEISPKSGNAGDWLELYNGSEERLNLSKWTLSDLKRNTFSFPSVTIEPHDYLVIAEDSVDFRAKHPKAYNVIGGMDFGLNKRAESIALYSILGAMVDSISYKAPPSDSAFVLSLLLPDLNNAAPENWAVRAGTGTPNAANPYYVESRVRAQQTLWMQIGLAGGVFVLSLLLLVLRQRKIL
jgi:hypothetical protein